MKSITFNLDITDSTPTVLIYGDQEELYNKYMADPSEENRIDFLNSVDEEIALSIDFGVYYFQEDLNV